MQEGEGGAYLVVLESSRKKHISHAGLKVATQIARRDVSVAAAAQPLLPPAMHRQVASNHGLCSHGLPAQCWEVAVPSIARHGDNGEALQRWDQVQDRRLGQRRLNDDLMNVAQAHNDAWGLHADPKPQHRPHPHGGNEQSWVRWRGSLTEAGPRTSTPQPGGTPSRATSRNTYSSWRGKQLGEQSMHARGRHTHGTSTGGTHRRASVFATEAAGIAGDFIEVGKDGGELGQRSVLLHRVDKPHPCARSETNLDPTGHVSGSGCSLCNFLSRQLGWDQWMRRRMRREGGGGGGRTIDKGTVSKPMDGVTSRSAAQPVPSRQQHRQLRAFAGQLSLPQPRWIPQS